MKKDRILSICMLLFCTVMYMETFNFAEKTSIQVAGPAVYPRILLYVIAGFSIIILIRSFFTKASGDESTVFSWKGFLDKYKKIVLLFLFFGVYVFLLSNVGFIMATLLFMFASQALLMGLKKTKPVIINVCVTSVSTFLVYFVFTESLSILLP
jgi:putative tricarboxylic transport membrane protein